MADANADKTPGTILNDVSDTALWVAVYRAWETARPDALFKDPFASRLAGDRGAHIEKQMSGSRYVSWSVVLRTVIIDEYFAQLIEKGIDTVINLGCGLDTRPYRLALPPNLRWVEVDFPHMIALKEERLANEKPHCRLDRFGLDLANENDRRDLFTKLNSESKKAALLTEGVTPYLSEEEVASLAAAIREQPNFKFWINEYSSPEMMKFLMNPKRNKEMRNAPFRFNPADWTAFYTKLGWRESEIHYIGEEAVRRKRPAPHPFFVQFVQRFLLSEETKAKYRRFSGYALMEPS